MKKAEVTVFLSLVFVLLFSFIAAIIESASIQVAKNYKRGDMDRAVESVFAEYQKELLEDYDIFALEATYETGDFVYENVMDRLVYYGAGEGEREIMGIRLLTDSGGQPFREQAAAYIENKLGIDSLNLLSGETQKWSNQNEESEEYQTEEQTVNQEMNVMLDEAEESLPEEDNPLTNISNIKNSTLLSIVVPDQEQISNKQVEINKLPSKRSINSGYGTFEVPNMNSALLQAAIGEYILEHFQSFTDEAEEGALSYEAEYILGGKQSDQENLEFVVKKLINIRFVSNYVHLQGDTQKKAEAQALALSLCTLLTVPGISEVVKQAILLAWAYGESIMDIRSLLGGKSVALVKTADNWQLSLSGLLTLGTDEDRKEGADMDGGLSYNEYLRILLFTANQNDLSMRTLDMIEKNLQVKKGFTFFKADQCISALQVQSCYTLRRGIRYQFQTNGGYQ